MRQFTLEQIHNSKSNKQFKKGDYIFKEGETPEGLFCISTGKIKLVKKGSNGKEQIVRLSKSGDTLGYRSLIAQDTYAASAIALENCEVCFVPKDDFIDLLNNNPQLNQQVMRLLTMDLGRAERHLTHIAQHSLRERVADSLLMLHELYGEDEKGCIAVSMSREDLANFVGTATESVIRLLSEFKQEGNIELQAKKIKLLNIEKLTKIASR
jgi:CRP/FNR family transcriptional regulator